MDVLQDVSVVLGTPLEELWLGWGRCKVGEFRMSAIDCVILREEDPKVAEVGASQILPWFLHQAEKAPCNAMMLLRAWRTRLALWR